MSAIRTSQGWTAPGFEGVQEAFERNFRDFDEIGAAFAAYRHGEPIVDLWGGISEKSSGTPWVADTISVIFSGTKALVAVCLLILLERDK